MLIIDHVTVDLALKLIIDVLSFIVDRSASAPAARRTTPPREEQNTPADDGKFLN